MPNLTEEDVRRIVREEKDALLGRDKYVFEKIIQILNGRNIQLGRTTGTKIGTEGYVSATNTGQKIGFYNTTPVIQPAEVSDPTGGATVDTQARDGVSSLIDLLQELGLMRS